MSQKYYSHTIGDNTDHWEELPQHLEEVSDMATQFSSSFNSGSWGHCVGHWHDFGKYKEEFQRRLYEMNIIKLPAGQVITADHSTAGAMQLWYGGTVKLGVKPPDWRRSLANIVAGHHGGLLDMDELLARMNKAEEMEAFKKLKPHADKVHSDVGAAGVFPAFAMSSLGLEMWTRMVYSCLVDADSLCTERFANQEMHKVRTKEKKMVSKMSRVGRRNLWTKIEKLIETRIAELQAVGSDLEINSLRSELMESSRSTALLPIPKPFRTMTAPTGLGKTFASMLYAVRHAKKHNLHRIIVVTPYTAIIDQTVKSYVSVLGNKLSSQVLLAHHSNLDPNDPDSYWGNLTSENWDVPIIVTTAVQFFESLLSNRRVRTRKIHNIANSMVIIDEPQLLPREYKETIDSVMDQLNENFGVSFLTVSATQPRTSKEVDASPPSLFSKAKKRLKVVFPESLEEFTSWEEIAEEVEQKDKVFVVVPRLKDAKNLATMLPVVGRYHLSTRMCPEHRRDKLVDIAQALKNDQTCRLIGTSIIETGIDLDFPCGFKYLAGLDSIAQAGGRVNRNGRLSQGILKVYVPEKEMPSIKKSVDATKNALKWLGSWTNLDITDPEIMKLYFREYDLITQYDTEIRENNSKIKQLREGLNFKSVANKFRMIERVTKSVVVPYGDWESRLMDYIKSPSRNNLRRLQPYIVELQNWDYQKIKNHVKVKELKKIGEPDALTISWIDSKQHYSPNLGINIPD